MSSLNIASLSDRALWAHYFSLRSLYVTLRLEEDEQIDWMAAVIDEINRRHPGSMARFIRANPQPDTLRLLAALFTEDWWESFYLQVLNPRLRIPRSVEKVRDNQDGVWGRHGLSQWVNLKTGRRLDEDDLLDKAPLLDITPREFTLEEA